LWTDKGENYMRTVKVYFSDGDSFISKINGTTDEIENYFFGKVFNIGSVTDKLVKCVRIEFLD
jgi:hypothetical protein